MPQNSDMWFDLALVQQFLELFPSVRGYPGVFLMDDGLDRGSHSCLLALDNPYGQVGVYFTFGSPL